MWDDNIGSFLKFDKCYIVTGFPNDIMTNSNFLDVSFESIPIISFPVIIIYTLPSVY